MTSVYVYFFQKKIKNVKYKKEIKIPDYQTGNCFTKITLFYYLWTVIIWGSVTYSREEIIVSYHSFKIWSTNLNFLTLSLIKKTFRPDPPRHFHIPIGRSVPRLDRARSNYNLQLNNISIIIDPCVLFLGETIYALQISRKHSPCWLGSNGVIKLSFTRSNWAKLV